MNSSSPSDSIPAIKEYLRQAPFHMLKELALDVIEQKHFSPEAEYFSVTTAIRKIENAAFAGEPDAARLLRDIAFEATNSLYRVTQILNAPTSELPPEPPGEFDPNRLNELTEELAQITTTDLQEHYNEIQKDLPSFDTEPYFSLIHRLLPGAHPRTKKQLMATKIVTSLFWRC